MITTTAPIKVLLAISDTGGGHRSAAVAISAALQAAGGEHVSCEILDMLQITGVPVVRSSPRLYDRLSTRWLKFYNTGFRLTNNVRLVNILSQLVYLRARANTVRALRSIQPHLVVITHPLTQRFIVAARRNYRFPFRIITVVTDLVTLHASWTYPGVDLCIVPTDEGHALMQRRGMPPERMVRTGFPVHPKFTSYTCSQRESRRDLELEEDRFTILVTSGGVGSGRVHDLVLDLERLYHNRQILVVTGKNKHLYDELRAQRRSRHTHVYGFVNNMEALMAASDVVITKAGPGTLMEALIMRRPVLVTEAVGMQERGNIDFILDHKLGFFCPTMEHIISAIEKLTHPSCYNATVERLANAVPSHGSAQIANILLEQAVQPRTPHARTRSRATSLI